MSEKDSMTLVKQPNTKESLINDLINLGLKRGDVVLAHASLSQLGWTIGREITVIDALLEVLGEEGTLIMPCQTGENSAPELWQNPPVPKEWVETIKANMPAFDPLRTPTRQMGKVVDALWHYPGACRSNHPQVSFCGYGKRAMEILEHHELTPGLGDGSPLNALYHCQAKILLLGVGYSNCTALHLSESHQNHLTWVNTGAKMWIDNEVKWIEFKEIDYDDGDFEAVGQAYEEKFRVNKGYVGAALCRYLPMHELCDFADQWFQEHRKGERE